jgi:hypothetical protein
MNTHKQQLPSSTAFHGVGAGVPVGGLKPSPHQTAFSHFFSQLYRECAQKVPPGAISSHGAHSFEPQSACEDHLSQHNHRQESKRKVVVKKKSANGKRAPRI